MTECLYYTQSMNKDWDNIMYALMKNFTRAFTWLPGLEERGYNDAHVVATIHAL